MKRPTRHQGRNLPHVCPCCGLPRHPLLVVHACHACSHREGGNVATTLKRWQAQGMPWTTGTPPHGWDPLQNLASLAHRVTMAKRAGRPPRMN